MSGPGEQAILAKLEALHEDVVEVKALAAATNGRVRTLELWRASVEGARAALSWRLPVALAVFGAVAGAVASALIGH